MAVKLVEVSVTTAGVAGAATGSGRVAVPGGVAKLVGLQVDYDAAAPATTDVTVKSKVGSYEKTILTLTDNNADWPMRQVLEVAYGATGSALAVVADIPNRVHPYCQGNLTVDVAQADALADCVKVYALFEV